MKSIFRYLAFSLALLSMPMIAQAGKKANQTAFEGGMRAWLLSSFQSLGDTKSRYIMAKAGCEIVVQINKDGKEVYIDLKKQFSLCSVSDESFLCVATIKLHEETKDIGNKYYDYCISGEAN